MSLKRIVRTRRLTPEEAQKYRTIRAQVAEELPDLVARHHERVEASEQLTKVLAQLKIMRKKRGMSLADVMNRTGMERSAISKLETGQRPNPTIDTLVRYAEAVGKKLVVKLADA